MLIVVDGPEKVGKTTLLAAVERKSRFFGWHVVRFACRRPAPFDPLVYQRALELAHRVDTLVLMDRSWASEAVYSQLLGRAPAMTAREAEWQLGRAVPRLGSATVVLDRAGRIARRRDDTDLPVDVNHEVQEFSKYGVDHGWNIAWQSEVDFESWISHKADQLLEDVVEVREAMKNCAQPWKVCGSAKNGVVVVGEVPGPGKLAPKCAWLPLSGYGVRWLQEVVPGPANRWLWTNASFYEEDEQVKAEVDRVPVAVALGRYAERRLVELEYPGQVVAVPHPAAARRWGKLRETWPPERYARVFEESKNEVGMYNQDEL